MFVNQCTQPTSPRRPSTSSEPPPLPPARDCRSSKPPSSSDAVHASPLCPLQLAISNLQPTDCRSFESPSALMRRPSEPPPARDFKSTTKRIADHPSPPPHSDAVHTAPRDRRRCRRWSPSSTCARRLSRGWRRVWLVGSRRGGLVVVVRRRRGGLVSIGWWGGRWEVG
ncbi:hypothetical protein TIFTF001_023484 [Ficus carica]|uniref:Uncharacterized protein n=1 Tax=Ficus carica TaxID=3494 RepID=A0AA88DG99_FICCA|nr:hypothetical protein TIFTF001_023484 [Ficus carica]